jgi:hypothetical protein
MVEISRGDSIDLSVASRDYVAVKPGLDLADPNFNKAWSAHRNLAAVHDDFHITTNGRAADWVKDMEKGGELSAADKELLLAVTELKRKISPDKFSNFLDRVDKMPPFQIGNLADSGRLSTLFDPKGTGSISAKDAIAAMADPKNSELDRVIAMSLVQHFFVGKQLDSTVEIDKIRTDLKDKHDW